MVVVKGLIWDDWNKEYVTKHGVSVEEVEGICNGEHEVVESYRNRLLVIGVTKKGRL